MSSTSVAAIALTAAFLILPGLVVSLSAGARLVIAVATAPVVSFGLVTAISRVATGTGLPWRPVTFVVAVLVVALAVALLRLVLRRTGFDTRLPWRAADRAPAPPVRTQLLAVAAGVLAAALGTGTAVWGMGGLTAINQGFDALFHVNAVTLISETRNADPSAVVAVNHFTPGSNYYPDAFHALAALVVDFGINPVVATNALVASVPAVLALGLVGVVWQLDMLRHALVAPFIGVSIAAFPTDIMWRGPIWPFALGLALVPAMLALLVGSLRQRSMGLAGLSVLGAAGVLLVHPSAALAAGIFAAAFLLQRWGTREGRLSTDLVPLAVISLLTVVVAFPAVVTAVSNSDNGAEYDWPAVQNAGEAVGELLLFNYDAPLPQIWLFVLLVIGLAGIRRLGRLAWWPATGAFFAVLLVMAAAYDGRLVALMTGPWWNDRFRFAAMATLGLGMLATHGVIVAADFLAALAGRVVARRRAATTSADGPAAAGGRTAVVRWVALAAVLGVFGFLSNGFYSDYNRSRMQLQFGPGTGGSVTAPEYEAMEEIARLVPDDQVVMNDPSDGSAWMWARHGVRPMFGQAVLTPIRPALEPDQEAVRTRFNCLDSSEEIRQIVDEYNIEYVYVAEGVIIPSMKRAPGLNGLADVESLQLVFDNGGAQIYRIVEQPLIDERDDDACEQSADTAGN
ncbi:DUF6541 family protein [Blastococcus sp. TF02A_35]|uniref:DUF6541 family protein n=1 Tax=Blastococcus sp. TF02A-35 TaxID=2559612 RepID=UPI0010730638|nr:DUF6541 family protein [Blastococcus sp. TF02A_35]TFV53591.1 hypothetical protein E4P43_01510 [Blastococcus sp. TF02A_35]